MEKPADKKDRNMKNLNEHLNPENPAHAIVIELNKRNEEMYGPIQECGLFERFCRCEKKGDGREESEAA